MERGQNSYPYRTATLLAILILLAGILSACTRSGNEGVLPDVNVTSEAISIKTNGTPEAGEPEAQVATDSEATTSEEDEQFLVIEEIIIGLLFVAVLVGIVAHRLRVPYTVGLVMIGLALTFAGQAEITISPNLILALLVPPLIFEAAFHLNYNELRYNLATILALAIPGVVLTMLIVGAVVTFGTGLPLSIALVFGALVAATDPVSVVALFRTMGVPKRLSILLEGESLFNDGTAIVLFDIVLVLALHGMGGFSWLSSLLEFFRVAGGGLAVGMVLGMIVSQIIRNIDDHLIETTLTSVLAFGSYLVAEELLGVSGVLAVVAAGLINGNIGPRGMSPTTRIVVFNFWEYAAFLSNSFIFLLIGLRIDLNLLFENWELILWAIAAVLVARAIGVYTLGRIGPEIPSKWRHVMYWGGLRGAISLALALSLPAGLANSAQIQIMAFGVVLFTLLVQGFSMGPLVRGMGLIERSEMQDEYERRHARAVAARASYDHLERRNRQGLLSDHTWKTLEPLLNEYLRNMADSVRGVLTANPSVEAEELDTARRESLRAQRSALTALLRDGIITEETYDLLVTEVDTALTQQHIGWPELIGTHNIRRAPVDRLMSVIIQDEDVENAFSGLSKLGFSVTRLPSTGGFLGKRNALLLIGLSKGHEETVYKSLKNSCRRRVEYLSSPLPGFPSEITTPTRVEIGGATIFAFEVERFEII